MHGQNPVRHFQKDRHLFEITKLQVQDVWHTIQGEGPYAGRPAVFIRLTGCNLRCHFCDTVWDDHNDPYESLDEIIERVKDVVGEYTSLIVITGGEPLIQNINPLVHALLSDGWKVQIETSGSVYRHCVEWADVTTVISPKVSIHHDFFGTTINERAQHFYKYIVRAGGGSETLLQGIPSQPTQINGTGTPGQAPVGPDRIYLQACDEGPGQEEATDANQKFAAELAMKFGYRVSVQIHKILDVP